MPADGDENDAPAADDPESVADIIEEAEPAVRVENDSDEEHAVSVVTDAEADGAEDDEEGAVAGSFAPDVAVTPQTPARENVVFVALGVYLTLLALAQTIPGVGVAPATIALVTVVVAVGTAACYGVLVWTTPDT